MRLDAFLLADAATAQPDGKVYIHGGGITRFDVVGLPFATPLSIYLRFVVDRDEFATPHQFDISLADPNGQTVAGMVNLRFEPSGGVVVETPEGEELFMQMALQFGLLTFTTEGVYTLTVRCDGEEARRMTLPVSLIPAATPPPPNRAERRRQERGRG